VSCVALDRVAYPEEGPIEPRRQENEEELRESDPFDDDIDEESVPLP
jgi:hypothetical protein